MKSLKMDVSDCVTDEDVYQRLLAILDAPGWHGHNLDALWGSITIDIKGLLPPYLIEVEGCEDVSRLVTELLSSVQAVFEEAQKAANVRVELRLI